MSRESHRTESSLSSEQNFEIILTNNLNLQDVSVSITVDESPIGRYYLAPGQKMLPGIYVSETTTKPFRFRSLVFNGGDLRCISGSPHAEERAI